MLVIDKALKENVDWHLSKFSKVLKNCLKAKNEEILVISDHGEGENKLASMMGYGFFQAAVKKGLRAGFVFQGVKKGFMQADDNVIEALKRLEEGSIVILCASNKLGRMGEMGKSFRTFCKSKNFRFVSTTGLGGLQVNKFDLFVESIDINYGRMQKQGLRIRNILSRAKKIRVRTENGTDITFDVEGKEAIANVGEYGEPGQGGNIPAGEVYLPPRGFEGVDGKIVIDGSMRCDEGTRLLEEPLVLVVEKGKVISIEGKHKELLEKTLVLREDRAKFPERVRMIGELGIGINPKALLIGSSILDEKVLGTAHIAIGSNHWFGGDIRTIVHLDQVFMNPKIFVDGELLKV